MRNEKSRPESAKAADQDISETIRPRKCQRPNPWKLEIMRSGLKQVLERKKVAAASKERRLRWRWCERKKECEGEKELLCFGGRESLSLFASEKEVGEIKRE